MINLHAAMPNSMHNGRYRILSRLHKGDVSAVYLAVDTADRNLPKMVLKQIQVENAKADETDKQNFVEEIRKFRAFPHFVFPRIFDHFLERDPDYTYSNFYVVMDYINGRDLEGIANVYEKKLPYPQLKKRAIELCDVLTLMHLASMPFGLLCPRHIMINHQGQVRLIDLGIGSSLNAGNNAHVKDYLPPDASPTAPTIDDDIYSLGTTLYRIVARPQSLTEIRYPSAQALTANSNAPFADVILKAIAPDPINRFQSIEQMRMALLELP